MPRIFGVIVTYQADEVLLSQLLKALSPQVSGGIIINNGSSLPLSDECYRETGLEVRHLQSNTGVATALNIGFQWAEAQNAEFVIMFDQDSEPAFDMIPRLLQAYQDLVASGQKVGAVGPQQVDRRTGRCADFIAPVSWRRHSVKPPPGRTVEVDHLITSGCLVPMDAWKTTGTFLDALFIDYVDIEWCLRMRHGGWHLFGVAGANLIHAMGEDIKHWGGWQIPWHSPTRHYFMIRNGIVLQRLPHITFGWKFADGLQILKKLVFFTLVARPRPAHVRALLRGISDGFRGRLGPSRCDH